MYPYWIVVADAARARIFGRGKKFGPLTEIEALVHPESRLRRQDLVTDRPGQIQESRTSGENAAGEGTDPKTLEARVFARELAGELAKATADGRCEHLVLLAAPRFLGALRNEFSEHTSRHVVAAEAIDLTTADTEAVARAADSALESA